MAKSDSKLVEWRNDEQEISKFQKHHDFITTMLKAELQKINSNRTQETQLHDYQIDAVLSAGKY